MNEEPIATALRRSVRDADAFLPLYRTHAEPLLIFVIRRVYEVEVAWDLTAETFARAYRKRGSFRGKTDLEAAGWLYAIAQRQIARYFRRGAAEKRMVERMKMQVPEPDSEEIARIVELAGIEHLRTTVRTELERLSAPQRDALELRVVGELPYDEVAQRLGISPQAARARVARGLKTLAGALDRHDDNAHLMEEYA